MVVAESEEAPSTRPPNVGVLLAFIAFVLTILLTAVAVFTGSDPWAFLLFAYLAAVALAAAVV